MSTSSLLRAATDRGPGSARSRDSTGIALALVLGAQLMIILDKSATAVNT